MTGAIGGFIEFERNFGKEYHDSCLRLNTGRNCLRYLIIANNIKKIMLPVYLCDAVWNVCEEERVLITPYSVDADLKPILPEKAETDTYVYVVNYFGGLDKAYISHLFEVYGDKLILDNAQAFFEKPIWGVHTIYTCRKFFGVPDGAYLYTNKLLCETIKKDSSGNRMQHLSGRFEEGPEPFYGKFLAHESLLGTLSLQEMSEWTQNLLRGIDYDTIRSEREKNYNKLDEIFREDNTLNIQSPKGPYMYPLYVQNAEYIRRELRKERIYIPLLWPNVSENNVAGKWDVLLAKNVLPLPCDQRYNGEQMIYMAERIKKIMNTDGSNDL